MNSFGYEDDHSFGTYQKRLRDIQQRDNHLEKSINVPRYSDGGPKPGEDEFPYPVLQISSGFDLHLVPTYHSMYAWIVDRTNDEINAETRCEYGFWLDDDERAESIDRFISDFERYADRRVPDGFAGHLESAFQEVSWLLDPFDETLVEKIRPPFVRWLRQRTVNVRADRTEFTGGQYVKTSWEIEVADEKSPSESTTRTLDGYYTDDLLQQSSRKFRGDYHRIFRNQIRLNNDWWFDISHFWIKQAQIRNYAEDDLPELRAGDVVLRPSGTGKYHLAKRQGSDSLCSSSPNLGEARPFSLDSLPVPQLVCSHCTPLVKRFQLAARLDDSRLIVGPS